MHFYYTLVGWFSAQALQIFYSVYFNLTFKQLIFKTKAERRLHANGVTLFEKKFVWIASLGSALALWYKSKFGCIPVTMSEFGRVL
jgi:hypothetical protein